MRDKKIVALIGPSGSGKGTLLDLFRESHFKKHFRYVKSVTTRPQRLEGQLADITRDCRNYNFVTIARFEEMMVAGEFAEWAKINGHYYGKTFFSIKEAIKDSFAVLEMDIKGFPVLKAAFQDLIVSVFIRARTIDELRQRLERRGTTEDIESRLERAKHELALEHIFDYTIVSETPQKSFGLLSQIVLENFNLS